MWYMGGKFRQSKALALVCAEEFEHSAYYEPFCGAMGAAERIVPALAAKGCKEFFLSDYSRPMVDLWNAALKGWVPPDEVPEEQYREYAKHRHGYIDDPMFAYCGHGISFGGKWYGGFARGGVNGPSTRRKQLAVKKAFMRKVAALSPYIAEVWHEDYANIRPERALVYCDPPYAGRTRAHLSTPPFDSSRFWRWAQALAQDSSNTVLVSEFEVPVAHDVLHDWGDTVVRHRGARGADGTREVLVRVR